MPAPDAAVWHAAALMVPHDTGVLLHEQHRSLHFVAAV